ncbi:MULTISPECIES: hypothetical protein [unclassified Phenylobacterium]|jgi:hypothetical protein|uniref:hypothetical protein n=1 Tax=unclassified Phenylobacterium TaxID=2640670 RepID=UPI000B028D98|nr:MULTISPECIES: hypothetical protein [unclassified Phenylobacterium]
MDTSMDEDQERLVALLTRAPLPNSPTIAGAALAAPACAPSSTTTAGANPVGAATL